MNSIRYLRDDERLAGTVSGVVDDDFLPQWLMDGRHAFPAKSTGGLNLSVSGTAVSADVVAVVNHNIPAGGNASFSGIGTVVTPAFGSDDIARNAYLLLDAPTSIGSFTFSTPGEVVGEVWVGLSHVLEMDFLMGKQFDPGKPFRWETHLAPYDDGTSEPRREKGEVILSAAGFAELVDAYTSTRKGKRPTLFILDDDVNDAWLAIWEYSSVRKEGKWFCTIEILELPRTSW